MEVNKSVNLKLYAINPRTERIVEVYPAMEYNFTYKDEKATDDNIDLSCRFDETIRFAMRCISLSLVPEVAAQNIPQQGKEFDVYANPTCVNGEVWIPIDSDPPSFMVRKWKPDKESLERLKAAFGNDITSWREDERLNSFGFIRIKLQVKEDVITGYPVYHANRYDAHATTS
jgi:hypothetical protein